MIVTPKGLSWQSSLAMLLLSLQYILVDAQTRINFIDNDWQAALDRAAAEDKLIFVDGYATWCVPCKVMDEEVFTAHGVPDYFNQHFVNVKIDVEKGMGPLLSARYNVGELPSYFITTADETLIYQFSGLQKVTTLLDHADRAQNPQLITQAWDRRYAEGDRKPSFLYQYAFAKYPLFDGSHRQIVEQYLTTQDDWATPENVKFIHHFIEGTQGEMFDFMVSNQEKFRSALSTEEVSRTVDLLVNNAIYHSDPQLTLEEVEILLMKSYPDDGRIRALKYRLAHHRKNNNIREIAATFTSMVTEFPSQMTNDSLRSIAQLCGSQIKDASQLLAAADWMNKLGKKTQVAADFGLAANLAEKAGIPSLAAQYLKSGFKKLKKKQGKTPEVLDLRRKYKMVKKKAKLKDE